MLLKVQACIYSKLKCIYKLIHVHVHVRTAAKAELTTHSRIRPAVAKSLWWHTRGTRREQGEARDELAVDLAKGALRVGECCGELKQGWTQAAACEVVCRERQEAGRELLRVCVRAWCEVTDGLPAGAARWEMLWRRGVECQLSRRLIYA